MCLCLINHDLSRTDSMLRKKQQRAVFPGLFYDTFLHYLCLVDYLSNATHELQDSFFSMCMHIHAYAHMHLDILNEYVTHFCFEPLINIKNKMANNNSNIHIYDTFSLFNTAQFFRGITYMIVEQNTITFLFVLHDFITFYLTTGSRHHSKMAEATGLWLFQWD